MADDRTLAPSAARLRRARRAGLRPYARALMPAVACGVLALALDGGALEVGPWLQPGAVAPEQWLGTVARWLVLGWLVAAAMVVAAAGLTRRFGSVSAVARRRLRPAPARPRTLVRSVLSLMLALGLLAAISGGLAGAARGVDASEAGLGVLWLGWAARISGAAAVVLGLAAIAELVLDRHERIRRLFLGRAEARELARDHGGRAR